MKLLLEGNRFGHYTITNLDTEEEQYIQSDYDFPGLARTFGWDGEDEDIAGAAEFLDSVDGSIIEIDDPGYFPEKEA